MMCAAKSEVLAFRSFPRAPRTQSHSTNPSEKLNAEVERRTNVVDIFPYHKTIIRLAGAMILEQNDEWSPQRRNAA